MSKSLLAGDVLFFQRLLAVAGLYAGKLDGVWGPKSDAAAKAWDAAYTGIREAFGQFDARTETTLQTILPAAQRVMRRLLARLRVEGLDARAISGTRSYQEQDALYRQGRAGKPGAIVTYARGGQSNHNFGLAVDIGIFDRAGRYLNGDTPGDLPPYEQAGALSAGIPGLEWGGNWPKKKRDLPHYQLATGLELEQVRLRFEAGHLIL